MTATISRPIDEDRPSGPELVGAAPAARAAWHPALLAVPVAAALAIAALIVAHRADVLDGTRIASAVLVTGWAAGGAAVASRRPLCRLGAVLLAGTVLGAVALAAGAALAAGWEGSGRDAAEVAVSVSVGLLPAVGLHVLLGLPAGELGGGGRRVVVFVGYAAALALGVARWAGPGEVSPGVALAAWIVAAAVGLPTAHAAYLRSTGLARQRLQWVGCGAATAGEVTVLAVALNILVDWPNRPGLVAAVASLLLPSAFAASASPRLVTSVDRLLVHTVSFAGLTLVTVAVYLVIVVGLGQVSDDADRTLLGLSMAAAAVAALLYMPARERLGEVANRLVYGERSAPDEVLRTFGSRLSRALPMDELLLQLAESLKKTLALTRAEVWTGSPVLLERTVSVPFAEPATLAIGDKERPIITRAGITGQAWAAVWLPALLADRPNAQLRIAPVAHSGELLGLLVVERPKDGDVFTDDDDTMLTELARQVGLALHNVQLDSALQATLDEVSRTNEELRASRARIVATGDAERRKIERNLHDGAQQHLVALAVNLRLAKDLIGEDPAIATEMLDQLAVDVKETIAELRALAHGIFPPLLVDAGLGDALRAAGRRSPLDVGVDVAATGRYGAEVEAAVYFCCLEALQNAAKHAPDSRVSVRVWEEAGGLRFEVVDDGPGFEATTARGGHGFTNMSDRLGAIGGSVRWDSTPGEGTRIDGSVPLGDERS